MPSFNACPIWSWRGSSRWLPSLSPPFPPQNIKTPADTGVALWVLLGTAVVNSPVWYLVHERSRQWQEAPDIGHLMETFPRRVDGLARLQRHLVKTFMTEFRYNEKLVGSTRRIVTTQTFLTLGSLCFAGLVLFEIL